MKRLLAPAAIALCLFVALSCWRWVGWQVVKSGIRRKFPEVPRIQTSELAASLHDPHRAPPVLLDIREPAEYAVSHLPGARRVEPGTDPATLGLPRDRPIVTYCSVGYRSAVYGRALRAAGFRDVRNLEGSIFQWANEGRPIEQGTGQVATKVHPYDKTWGLLLRPAVRAEPEGDPPKD